MRKLQILLMLTLMSIGTITYTVNNSSQVILKADSWGLDLTTVGFTDHEVTGIPYTGNDIDEIKRLVGDYGFSADYIKETKLVTITRGSGLIKRYEDRFNKIPSDHAQAKVELEKLINDYIVEVLGNNNKHLTPKILDALTKSQNDLVNVDRQTGVGHFFRFIMHLDESLLNLIEITTVIDSLNWDTATKDKAFNNYLTNNFNYYNNKQNFILMGHEYAKQVYELNGLNKWIVDPNDANKKQYTYNGNLIKNNIQTIDGKDYYFDGNGYLTYGLFDFNGQRYSDPKSGVLYQDTQVTINGDVYSIGKQGIVTNIFKPKQQSNNITQQASKSQFSGSKAILDQNGGWDKNNAGRWEWFIGNNQGLHTHSGWEQFKAGDSWTSLNDNKKHILKGGWLYQLSDKSYATKQWLKVKGKWYWFDKNGYVNTHIGWEKCKHGWAYSLGTSGYYTNTTKYIDGHTYKFDTNAYAHKIK